MGELTATELDELREIHAIKQLKARYVRTADLQDWEGYRDVLTEDFRFDSDGGVQEGRDAVVAMVSASLAGASTVHHLFTPEITITGPDTAEAIWPMEDYVRMTLHGQPYAFHGCGHYTESYVKTTAGWRIKASTLTRLRVDPIDVHTQELRDIEGSSSSRVRSAACSTRRTGPVGPSC